MKISTKGRYALRMLLDLAEHRADGYIALRNRKDRISVSHVDMACEDTPTRSPTSPGSVFSPSAIPADAF